MKCGGRMKKMGREGKKAGGGGGDVVRLKVNQRRQISNWLTQSVLLVETLQPVIDSTSQLIVIWECYD